MLYSLRIRNFALIDELELEFGTGLNVLTGETGAGKSIILDAIDIALGGKSQTRLLRQGSERGIVEATFQAEPAVKEWLTVQEIDLLDDGMVVCSREISLTKDSLRSRSRINGVLVNRHLISQLRHLLVEITAQGQTVQLMYPDKQRQLLDLYGGSPILEYLRIVAQSYAACQTVAKALENVRKSEQERLQKLDWLKYQIQELEKADLQDEWELEQLATERDRLSHVTQLQQLSYQVYQLLYQNDNSPYDNSPSAADLLGEAESHLRDMVNYDLSLEPILDMVKTAQDQVVEAGHQIHSYGEGLETDPERLQQLEERIIQLKRLCRKYGPSLGEVIAHYEKLHLELDQLTQTGQSLEELELEYALRQQELTKVCEHLTQLRLQAAFKLEQQLTRELKPLAMDKVIFECRINPGKVTATGADQVIFCFSPNPGEKVQPLADTASGGEMSRFLLALKACFSQSQTGCDTLIFDEIDTGVSGKVAAAIAAKLHQLSHQQQVLCVTHQPLIAAMADVHLRVEKQMVEDNREIRTVVRVRSLDQHISRREELAELSGGQADSEAIAFAESLLIQAEARRLGNSQAKISQD